MYQKGRVYSLIVGNYQTGEGVKIDGLKLRFDISKSADNKARANSAIVEITNLSQTTLDKLQTDFLSCSLALGWEDQALIQILSGNVVENKTVKQGDDTITQLKLGEGFTALNHQTLSGNIAPGKTVKDVLEEIVKQMPGISTGILAGTNLNNPVVFGYPLIGTPKEMLDDLTDANNVEYRIDNGVISTSDINGLISKNTSVAPVISESSGLIDIPFYTSEEGAKLPKDKQRRKGIQFKALINPEVVPGSIVRVESKRINGWYRVNSARYYGDTRGNDWYMDVFCTIILEDDLK